MTVIPFPTRRTPESYRAKAFFVHDEGFRFQMSGQIEGYIDFCITEGNGRHATYPITCDGARALIAALHGVVDDIQKNCLFDRDPCLMPEDYERPAI